MISAVRRREIFFFFIPEYRHMRRFLFFSHFAIGLAFSVRESSRQQETETVLSEEPDRHRLKSQEQCDLKRKNLGCSSRSCCETHHRGFYPKHHGREIILSLPPLFTFFFILRTILIWYVLNFTKILITKFPSSSP